MFIRAYVHMYRLQEGERFINYVDSVLDSYNPYFDLEILIIIAWNNLACRHYRNIDLIFVRYFFQPFFFLRRESKLVHDHSKLSSIRNSMYPQARGSPANRYPFIIIYLERIARQDFFRYPDNRPGNR